LTTGISFSTEVGPFPIRHRVWTGSGTHPASCQMGSWGSFRGSKATGAWNSPLTYA